MCDDLVDEVYLVAWRRLYSAPFDADEARAWLCTVARNILANSRRRARRHPEIPCPPSELPRLLYVGQEAERLAAHEAFRRVGVADRRILGLVALRGPTLADLAAELDCSAGAAAVRLSRARHRLAHAMDG